MALWGGVECTVNRIGDRLHDQVRRTGHHDRLEDLDRFAALGLSALRYPVLWERVAPDGLAHADWSWTDERLARLRDLGIQPIAGLLHHGSGPRATDLLDPAFPELFTRYAAAVAGRYPWLEDYTPINEPLTTARFSGMYGHWYPHQRNSRAFVTALLHEIKATVLAMQAIRQVNPAARLIQTEDAGRTYSTPRLAYQAAFDNHRQWLTGDLLTGRVGPQHALWGWLLRAGASQAELEWLLEHPCRPDVMGLNYYFTSDRYLDHELEHYSSDLHGGNGRDQYVDVEAVRVMPEGLTGHRRILEDTWHRYQLPVAITEVHAGCSREDQMRWLLEAWNGALQARAAGADVRAVTLWALLGSFDWNSLLTRCDGVYEPGAFDLRNTPPRGTALAGLAQALATGNRPEPVAGEPGWWHRPERITCGRTAYRPAMTGPSTAGCAEAPRRLLVTGAHGTLGSAFIRACAARGLAAVGCSRTDLDITDPAAVQRAVADLRPWAIINAAGHVRVDDAEAEPDACLRLNSDAPATLAAACAQAGIRFVTFSSDLVFDGTLRRPYVESDRPSPLNVYGVSKVEAEARVIEACPDGLVIRTSAFFGPVDPHNFVTQALRRIADGEPFQAAGDTIVSPTYVPDLVWTALDLLLDGESGLWHLANRGEVTWSDFAREAAERAGLDSSLVLAVPMRLIAGPASRPAYSVLGSERAALLPSLENALGRYLRETGTPEALEQRFRAAG
jgi:dTDP-4-dehydrorhamnose reductase